jgi:hypothetical protein
MIEEQVPSSPRMNWGWYRWITTYVYAMSVLWEYGERAWPWNVRFVWPEAKRRIDQLYPRKR